MENIKLSKNGITVTIDTVDDTENLTKILTIINIPNPTGNRDSGPKDNKIVDLQRVEHRITVRGHLSSGTVSGDTSSTADGRKADLKTIFKAGGVISMTYEGATFSVNIDKLDIPRSRGVEGDTLNSGDVGYDVTFTAIKGVDV